MILQKLCGYPIEMKSPKIPFQKKIYLFIYYPLIFKIKLMLERNRTVTQGYFYVPGIYQNKPQEFLAVVK